MTGNLLLDAMPDGARRRFLAAADTVDLHMRETLIEAHAGPAYAYFPLSGVCSTLVHVESGEAVEVGLVGNEGMVGLPIVLGGAVQPFHIIVQAHGTAIRVSAELLAHECSQPGSDAHAAMLGYAGLVLGNIGQVAACNRLHRIEKRLARWLLDMRDRMHSVTLPMTHEWLALMVGAYRPSITNALAAMEERGLLVLGRGIMTIVNNEGVEAQACDCYGIMQRRMAQTLEEIRSAAA